MENNTTCKRTSYAFNSCQLFTFFLLTFRAKHQLLIPLLFLIINPAWSQTYNTTGVGTTVSITIPGNTEASGTYYKWSDASNWSGGVIPTIGGVLASGKTVNIDHDIVYDMSDDLKINDGAVANINDASFITPLTGTGSGKSVFVFDGGTFNMCNAEFRLPIWEREDIAEVSRTDLSGNFETSGTVIIYNSSVDVAQNWTGKGGIREINGGCLRIGESYKNEGANDTYVDTCISLGWHNSGNFDASSGRIEVIDSDILFRGTSGNFNINIVVTGTSGVCVMGSINNLDIVDNAVINDSGDSDCPTWNVSIGNYCIGDSITDNTMAASCGTCIDDQFIDAIGSATLDCSINTLECTDCEDDVCEMSIDCSSTPASCDGNSPASDATITVTTTNANATCGLNGSGITYTLCDGSGNPIGSPVETTDTTYAFIDLPPGDYKVKIVDAAGCEDECEITIDDPNCCLPDPIDSQCKTAGPIDYSDASCQDVYDNNNNTGVVKLDTSISGTKYVYLEVDNENVCCGLVLLNPKHGQNCIPVFLSGPNGIAATDVTEIGFIDENQCPIDEFTFDCLDNCGEPLIASIPCPTDGIPDGHIMEFLGRTAIDNTGVSYWYYKVTSKAVGCDAINGISHLTFGLFDDECGDCTPAATCNLSSINDEACSVPSAFTDPADVFSGIEACGAVVSMTNADVGDTDVCGDGTGASFTRTYSLIFDGIEFATCEQTIIISDITPPSIDCPAPIDLGCNPTLPTTSDAEAEVTTDDNCGIKSVVATAGAITGGCTKTQIFNVVVTDNCDNTADCDVTYTWTDDSIDPSIDCPAPIDLGCNPTLPTTGDAEAEVTTDDNCGIKSVVATAGAITGGCTKTQIFNVVVTDNCDNTADCDVTYTWSDDSINPSIDCPASPIDLDCNPTLPTTGNAEAEVTTDDNCGIKSVVATAGAITGGCTKTQIFNVVVTDNCDNTANCDVTYTWSDDSINPSIDCPVSPIDLGCNPTLPTTGDAEAEVTTDDNCGIKSVVATAGAVTGGCTKTQIFNVVVTDNCDNTADCDVTYTWSDDSVDPSIDCPAPIDLGCNPTLPTTGDAEAAVTTDDNCGIKSVVATAGAITGGCTKTQIFNVVVTDNCDNTANCDVTYTWSDDSVDASLDCPASPIDLGCNPTLPTTGDAEAAVTTNDNCGIKSVVATAGAITGGCTKTQIFNVVVTDNCDNTADCDVTYTWSDDSINPSIDCPVSSIDLGCNPTLPTTGDAEAAVTTDDNCGIKSLVATAGAITGGCTKTQIFNVVVTDNCDNTADCDVTYTWSDDSINPSIDCPVSPIDLGCNPTLPTTGDAEAEVTTDDNCGIKSVVATAGAITGGCTKTQIFNVVVTDNCDNTADCDVTYTWSDDSINPSIDCPASPIDLGCNPTLPTTGDAEAEVTTDDNCGIKSVVATAGDITGGCTKTQIFNVVVTDNCDNTADCDVTYTWTDDSIDPSIDCPASPIDLSCNPTLPTTGDAEAAVITDDNCGIKSVVATAGAIIGDCIKTQIFNVIVTDNCDNTANCDVTYTWSEIEAPSIICNYTETTDLGCNPSEADIPTGLSLIEDGYITAINSCGEDSQNIILDRTEFVTEDCEHRLTYYYKTIDGCHDNPQEASCSVTFYWEEDEPLECEITYAKSKEFSDCFLTDDDVDSNLWGWTTHYDDPGTYILLLYAGAEDCGYSSNGTNVGYVVVSYTGSYITLTYVIYDPYVLSEVNAYIGCDKYPLDNEGEPTADPDFYNYNSGPLNSVTRYTVGPIMLKNTNGINLITQAVTCVLNCGCTDVESNTASYPLTDDNDTLDCEDGSLSIGSISNSPSFIAYPVPFKDDVFINYKFNYETDVIIEVFDIKGALLKRIINRNYSSGSKFETSLDFRNFSNQLFFVKLTTNKGTGIKKIVSF